MQGEKESTEGASEIVCPGTFLSKLFNATLVQGEQESVLKERQRESAEEAAERAAAKTAAALVCFLNYEVSLAYISGHHDFKSWFIHGWAIR